MFHLWFTLLGGSFIEGVQELRVPFVVHPLRWFFHLLGHGSFHFVRCIPPFWGALVYL
jgi:hypothetical protein